MVFPLDMFQRAREELIPILNPTQLQRSRTFGEMAGCDIFLKPECLQKTGSFKIRGAYHLLKSLKIGEENNGVVTFSAGNWAQGVAYGCQLLDMEALIVMPEAVPRTKLKATQSYGAEVILYGSTSVELSEKAKELSRSRGMNFINAFDEPKMIIGHGSVGLEIFEEQPDTDIIVVPVGGGTLISGIALTARQLNPKTRVYGVQPEGAAAMHASLKANYVVEIDSVNTIAEGLALKRSGEKTFQIIKENVEDVVLVSDEEIKSAVSLLIERAKLLVEPSGAVPLAALLGGKIGALNKENKVVLLLSGGNVDPSVLINILS